VDASVEVCAVQSARGARAADDYMTRRSRR